MRSIVAMLLLVAGTVLSVDPPTTGVHAAPANSAVTTLRNDNALTGQYPIESVLNTGNVSPSQFGKRVTYPVDGQVYAQPLSLPNLTIGGRAHYVVFPATENDTVYAFDADATSAGGAAVEDQPGARRRERSARLYPGMRRPATDHLNHPHAGD